MNLCYLDCLDNLVSYKGDCAVVDATSCIYLNDFTGFEVKTLNAGVSGEQQNAFDFIDAKIRTAKLALANDIIASLPPNQAAYTLLERDVIGRYQDNMPVLAAQNGYYKGVKIYSNQSSFTELYISSIALQVGVTGDVPVFVWDLITGKLLDTFTVACVADEITQLVINKGYLSTKKKLSLFIGYESNIASFETPVGGGNCGSCGSREHGNQHVTFMAGKIPTGSQKISSNIQAESYTAGLSITYAVNCAIEPFVCQISHLLALPLAYKTLNQIFKEMEVSKRFNSSVLAYREDHKELAEYYQNEYQNSMGVIMQGAVFNDPVCFPCKPRVSVKTYLP